MSDVPFISSNASSRADTEQAAPKPAVVALRERKKDQTRDALARAALALFQDKGYEATTVAEIARAANVSRRTFFRYFPTKDALLFVETEDHFERFRETLESREPGEAAGDPVRRACLAQASEYMRDRDQFVARARIIESSPGLSKQERQQDLLWEQAISEALLAGGRQTAVAERRARMLSGAIVGAMRAAILEWQRLDGGADLVRLTNEALDLFDLRDIDLDSRRSSPAAN